MALIQRLLQEQPDIQIQKLIAHVQQEQGLSISKARMCRVRQQLRSTIAG